MEGMAHQYCLRWNNFQNNIASALGSLKAEEDLVDVTLSCGGRIVKAHKVVLSACSPYFREVFKENPCQHPVVILKDVSYEDILSLLSFMYVGEVYITKEQIQTFLQTAELLQIRGLAGVTNLAKECNERPANWCVQQQVDPVPLSKTHVPPPLSTLYPKPAIHVGDGSAQLKHALSTKRSRTTATATTASPPPSPPPPLGRSSAPSSPQPLAAKRRKAVPRRVSTSSPGGLLPAEVNAEALQAASASAVASAAVCPPGAASLEDGDSAERFVVGQVVKQEVEDIEFQDETQDRDDVLDQDNDHDGDSRGDDRPYYMDSDHDGEAGTSSSLLARSLAGASPRGVEGTGSLATNNQTMGADLTVDVDGEGVYNTWAAGPVAAAGACLAGPSAGHGHGLGQGGGPRPHRQTDRPAFQPGTVGAPATTWGCMQPRSCILCHRTFSNKFNLKQHIENVHAPGKPIPCQICNRSFKNKWYLRKHCVTTHNAPLRRIKTPWGKIMYVSDNP